MCFSPDAKLQAAATIYAGLLTNPGQDRLERPDTLVTKAVEELCAALVAQHHRANPSGPDPLRDGDATAEAIGDAMAEGVVRRLNDRDNPLREAIDDSIQRLELAEVALIDPKQIPYASKHIAAALARLQEAAR